MCSQHSKYLIGRGRDMKVPTTVAGESTSERMTANYMDSI
jgi:hypothetical protein